MVVGLPHGGSVTVQFNPYLVIEHPIIRRVLRANALWVGMWKYVPLLTLNVTLTLTLTLTLPLTLIVHRTLRSMSFRGWAWPPD